MTDGPTSATRSWFHQLAFRMLVLLCFLFGIDLRPKKTESAAIVKDSFSLQNFLRLLHGTFLATFVVGNCIDIYSYFDANPSTSDFVELIYFVNTVCILAESQRTLWIHQRSLGSFFHDNQEHFDSFRFAILMILNVVYSCMDFKVVIHKKGLVGLVSASSALVAWQFQTLYAILHMQSAAILCGKLRCLKLCAIYNWRNSNLNRKAMIRDDIAVLNGIFGTVSFFMYMKVFSLLYNVLVSLITSKDTLPWAIIDASVPSLQLLTLYDTARLSTRMTEVCHSIAADFLESEHFVSRKYRILCHDPYRDDLTVFRVFALHKGTFLKYLATVVTFIAVLAQFDYKLIKLLNKPQVSKK